MARDNKTQPKTLKAAERRPLVFDLRKRGFSYRAITEELNIQLAERGMKPVSQTTVFNDVRHVLRELNKKASLEALEMRRLVTERIEWAVSALAPYIDPGSVRLQAGEDSEQEKADAVSVAVAILRGFPILEKAIGRLIQLNEQLIKLYGLSEPETTVHLLLDEDVIQFLEEQDLSMSDVVRAFNDMLRKKHLARIEGGE